MSGDLLFTAGFGPQDPATGEVADSVAEQTRQVLRNLQAVLAERGATLDDALKATVHLADLADAPAFNEAYREFFTEPFPARTTVGSELANILVEIDLVVRIPG
ncbi:MAG TPA: RidA family protein [Brachybacterium sp.]|nr:RidA family protein [Brachybacterium sp.]